MATLGLLLVSLIWGTTFVAVKGALETVPPLLFLGLRFGIATLAALPLLRRREGLREALLWGVPLGLVLGAAYAAQTIGLVTTTPARSGFLTGLNVLMIPLWGIWLVGRKPAASAWVALAVSALGMWFLTAPEAGGWVRGDTWTLACAALFGLHVALLSRFGTTHQTGGLLVSQLATSAAFGFVAHAIWGGGVGATDWRSSFLWGALLLTGVAASLVTTWLQLTLQPKVSPVRVAVVFATEPVFAALVSVLFWGERLGTAGWIGGGLVLAAMLLVEIGAVRRGRAPAAA